MEDENRSIDDLAAAEPAGRRKPEPPTPGAQDAGREPLAAPDTAEIIGHDSPLARELSRHGFEVASPLDPTPNRLPPSAFPVTLRPGYRGKANDTPKGSSADPRDCVRFTRRGERSTRLPSGEVEASDREKEPSHRREHPPYGGTPWTPVQMRDC